MHKHLKKALLACLVLFFSLSVSSQYRRKRNQFLEGFKVQPKAGINMFFGDLVTQGRTNYVFGVAAEKEVLPFLNVRLDVDYGSMKGTQINEGFTEPYAYFKNSFMYFNAGATFRPLDLAFGLFRQRLFKPYVIGQIGMVQYSATEYWGPDGPIRSGFREVDDVWRETSGMTPNLSFGGGVSFYFTSNISFTAEFIATALVSDQLDGHDVWYTGWFDYDDTGDPNTLTEYQTEGNDFFYMGTVGLTYTFDDSHWKNSPKYNRKAYLRTRSLYKQKRSKKYKRPSKRSVKRYRRR